MSIQVTTRQRDRVTNLPAELVIEICSYLRGMGNSTEDDLADRIILATSMVCRNWRDNGCLQEERQKAARRRMLREFKIEAQYPISICQIFRNANMHIFQLPVLKVERSPIIRPWGKNDLTHPVMRFTDATGTAGIALNISGRDTSQGIIRISSFCTRIRSLKNITTFYDHNLSTGRSNSGWTYSWGPLRHSFIQFFYNVEQPFLLADPLFRGSAVLNNNRQLSDLLLDTDQDFVISTPPIPLSERCSRFLSKTMKRASILIVPLAIGIIGACTQGCE
jgi:hypothetical protein